MARDGTIEETVLQGVVEDVQRAAGVKKEIRTADYFDFGFLRKAREQLIGSGWKPQWDVRIVHAFATRTAKLG
jgi:hypothetical protein